MDRLKFYDRIMTLKALLLQKYVPDRHWEEMYDHRRTYQISLWYGEGQAETGVLFQVEAGTWDGNIDETRIDAIMADKAQYITFDKPSYQLTWDLADLSKMRDLRNDAEKRAMEAAS